MTKYILVTFFIFINAALLAQEVDFIQKMERSDIPLPYRESTGWQVDIDGDYAVASSPRGSSSLNSQNGVVLVYKYNSIQDVWEEIKVLSPSHDYDEAEFGWKVNLEGDVIAVTHAGVEVDGLIEVRAIFVFQKDEGGIDNWGEVRRIPIPPSSGLTSGGIISATDSLLIFHSFVGQEVFIFERDQGGQDNWGLSKTIVTESLGSFALSNAITHDRLVYQKRNNGIFIHGRNVGGTDNWGLLKKISQAAFSEGGMIIQDSFLIVTNASNTVNVYKENSGGPNNWGRIQSIGGVGNFGFSLDLKDSLLIVGADRDNTNGDNSGLAHIYRFSPSLSLPLQELKVISPSAPREENFFGADVAIQGDYALVGASRSSLFGGAPLSGRALFFKRDEGGVDNWGEKQEIEDGLNGVLSQYGRVIDADNDLMITSAQEGKNPGVNNSGVAYIYARDEGGLNNWGEIKRLSAPSPTSGTRYGKQVKVSDTIAVVSDNSRIYIYYRNSGGQDNWGLVRTITQGSSFIDVDGDDLVVSSNQDIRVFSRDIGGSDNWGLLKLLQSPLDGIREITTVSIYEDDILVGDPGAASAGNGFVGRVHHFNRNQGGQDNWGFIESLTASDKTNADHFGSDLSIYEDLLVVSSKNSDSGSARQLYIFEREENGFEEKKIIESFATNSPTFSQFSRSVAITDRFIVTGDQRENALIGEAYVFGRNVGGASNWGLVKKVIPPDAVRRDAFSREVGITGNSIFIHSAADGSHGSNSGSVYHFEIEPREKVWTGNIDSDWNNTMNWSSEIVPVNGDDVAIPLRVNQPIIDVTTAVLNSIVIERKASVIVTPAGDLKVEE